VASVSDPRYAELAQAVRRGHHLQRVVEFI
jgi:hypothetical protein